MKRTQKEGAATSGKEETAPVSPQRETRPLYPPVAGTTTLPKLYSITHAFACWEGRENVEVHLVRDDRVKAVAPYALLLSGYEEMRLWDRHMYEDCIDGMFTEAEAAICVDYFKRVRRSDVTPTEVQLPWNPSEVYVPAGPFYACDATGIEKCIVTEYPFSIMGYYFTDECAAMTIRRYALAHAVLDAIEGYRCDRILSGARETLQSTQYKELVSAVKEYFPMVVSCGLDATRKWVDDLRMREMLDPSVSTDPRLADL